MHGGRPPGQVQAPGMQHKRAEHPARAPAVVRVQDQPSCAHQDKLLLQRQRQQHQLGAQHGHGRPAGALRGHGRLAGRMCANRVCVNFNHLIGRCCTIQLCPKSPWVYSLSFAYMQSYDGTPAFAHSLRPRRPAPRPPLMPLVAPPPRVLLPRPPGLPAPPAAATWAADRVRVRPALPPAFASPCSPSSRTLSSPLLL